jgi:uncharacterized phiE125 gp8 family phage protein
MISPRLSTATAATTPVVSLDELCDHLKLDSSDDEAYVLALAEAAREYLENVTGRAMTLATYRLTASQWSDLITHGTDLITLPRFPVVEIDSVKYIAPDASTQTTVDDGDYELIATNDLIYFEDRPDENTERPDAVEILFQAGYATAAEVPATLRHALKMLVAHWYENRMPLAAVALQQIPFSLQALITHNRTTGFFT